VSQKTVLFRFLLKNFQKSPIRGYFHAIFEKNFLELIELTTNLEQKLDIALFLEAFSSSQFCLLSVADSSCSRVEFETLPYQIYYVAKPKHILHVISPIWSFLSTVPVHLLHVLELVLI
jgi:hypothetical protein